jgi:hypothetical protein
MAIQTLYHTFRDGVVSPRMGFPNVMNRKFAFYEVETDRVRAKNTSPEHLLKEVCIRQRWIYFYFYPEQNLTKIQNPSVWKETISTLYRKRNLQSAGADA